MRRSLGGNKTFESAWGIKRELPTMSLMERLQKRRYMGWCRLLCIQISATMQPLANMMKTYDANRRKKTGYLLVMVTLKPSICRIRLLYVKFSIPAALDGGSSNVINCTQREQDPTKQMQLLHQIQSIQSLQFEIVEPSRGAIKIHSN